jgi:hypothetical protein
VQIVVSDGKTRLEPADSAFLNERNWPMPRAGRGFACAVDAAGKELGRQEIEIEHIGSAEKVANFIHQHAPVPEDAEKKWSAACADTN